jgi:hypothetical protein
MRAISAAADPGNLCPIPCGDRYPGLRRGNPHGHQARQKLSTAHCLNPNRLSVDLLNRFFAPLRQMVVGDHQERISNVMVQLPNPLQPV